MIKNDIFELIKLSLWGEGNPKVDYAVYQEMKNQAISALPASALSSLHLSFELAREWRTTILQQIAYFANYRHVQSSLSLDMPYVILKGTSAAQYYPRPEYRTMGDIDLMTRREDYAASCETMLKNGWRETTAGFDLKRGRHRTFVKKGIVVEIHGFFASMNDVKKARAFDDLILRNITDNHMLPDLVNGLVLIEHVNQHMEEGIGLRQIIDWMMFVDRCLPDEKWLEFEKMAEQTGLKELAIVTTRMCEMYLGLSAHKWCAGASEKLCNDLMDYVLKCGNFGTKLEQTNGIRASGLHQLRHPLVVVRELQEKGRENFMISGNPIIKPFAWILEVFRQIRQTPHFLKKYRDAWKTNEMLKALGVTRRKDELVFYENGRYFNKKV